MNLGYFSYPMPVNEPVLSYAPGSLERAQLKKVLAELKSVETDMPMYIGGDEVRTGNKVALHPPHELQHTLGHFHAGDEGHVRQAIEAAMKAREAWANMPWEERAHILPENSRPDGWQIQVSHERDHYARTKQECVPG
jgi:1-pyrroline-5-carboxylate dehydrogenase